MEFLWHSAKLLVDSRGASQRPSGPPNFVGICSPAGTTSYDVLIEVHAPMGTRRSATFTCPQVGTERTLSVTAPPGWSMVMLSRHWRSARSLSWGRPSHSVLSSEERK